MIYTFEHGTEKKVYVTDGSRRLRALTHSMDKMHDATTPLSAARSEGNVKKNS